MGRWFWGGLGLAAVAALSFAVGLIAGELHANYMTKLSLFRRERTVIRQVLAGDPAWRHIHLEFTTPHGTAYLHGSVPTQADLDRLRTRVEHAVGAAESEDRFSLIGVGPPDPSIDPAGREP